MMRLFSINELVVAHSSGHASNDHVLLSYVVELGSLLRSY